MVGAKSQMLTRRWASSGVHDTGEDPAMRRADRTVGERRDHQGSSRCTLPECPVRLTAHARPQRTITGRASPSPQRRPSLGPTQAQRLPRTRARLHGRVGQQRAAPEQQRQHDRRRRVATVWQLAARPHHDHCATLLALVAPLQQRADLGSGLRFSIRWAPALSFAHAVPVQHHLAARRPRRCRADRAPRRPTCVDLGRRLLPGLDVEIEVDHMTLALGVVVSQRRLRRRLGRAVRLTPTRPPSLVRGPGLAPVARPRSRLQKTCSMMRAASLGAAAASSCVDYPGAKPAIRPAR